MRTLTLRIALCAIVPASGVVAQPAARASFTSEEREAIRRRILQEGRPSTTTSPRRCGPPPARRRASPSQSPAAARGRGIAPGGRSFGWSSDVSRDQLDDDDQPADREQPGAREESRAREDLEDDEDAEREDGEGGCGEIPIHGRSSGAFARLSQPPAPTESNGRRWATIRRSGGNSEPVLARAMAGRHPPAGSQAQGGLRGPLGSATCGPTGISRCSSGPPRCR